VSVEEPVDPYRRIIDCHHHMWPLGESHGTGAARYLFDDLLADRGTHHNVTDTVFIQCDVRYRQDGPEAMRPVGETEFIATHARESSGGPARLSGIIAYADLTLGDAVEEVLHAHEAAGDGRFRGIRYGVYSCPEIPLGESPPRPGLLAERDFRRALTRLGANGYLSEVFVLHPQLPELADAARSLDGTTFVLNHLGGPLNVGPFSDRDQVRPVWRAGMKEVASCPNVVLKLGGVGMSLLTPQWSAREPKPDSEEIAAHWRDDIRWCIDTFGPSRCMFESNFPVDRMLVSYDALWNAFQKIASVYSADEQDALFSNTAGRVYRIGAHPLT
jgi:predicted TIM-barrel fold metal-dependent hydrolase